MASVSSGSIDYSQSGGVEVPVAIRLPAISNDFESGNIAEWYKNEGDLVEVGDIIIDVETDKATIEVESVDAGVLAKILIPTGTEEVPVNTLIGVLLSDGEGEKELQAFLAMELSASDASDASDSAQEVEELEAVSANLPLMRNLSPLLTSVKKIRSGYLSVRLRDAWLTSWVLIL